MRVCDEVRDQRLGDLGVRMEDKEEGTVVKIVGREVIQREREREREVRDQSWSDVWCHSVITRSRRRR